MIQWFLFDRIDAETGTFSIGGEDHLAVDILADKAERSLTIAHFAVSRAKVADDPFAIWLTFVWTKEPADMMLVGLCHDGDFSTTTSSYRV